MATPSPLLPTRSRQQDLLRDLVVVLAEGGAQPFLVSEILPSSSSVDLPGREQARSWRRRRGLAVRGEEVARIDVTAVCLGLGAVVVAEELSVGLDGRRQRDPSLDWKRPAALDLSRILGAAGLTAAPPSPLTAKEITFLLAAQVVARCPDAKSRRAFGPGWRARTVPRAMRANFDAALSSMLLPRDALRSQLGFCEAPPPRRRRFLNFDGSVHFAEFDALLGVERVSAPRPGLLSRLLGGVDVRLRCSAPRCRAPLPDWSPRCVACGRSLKGEAPLDGPR